MMILGNIINLIEDITIIQILPILGKMVLTKPKQASKTTFKLFIKQ